MVVVGTVSDVTLTTLSLTSSVLKFLQLHKIIKEEQPLKVLLAAHLSIEFNEKAIS